MKRPVWMTLVGIVAIILGFWGTLGDLLSVIYSVINAVEPENARSQSFFETPAWTIAAGLISLFVSGAYLLAGIFLLTKSFGIRFFYKVIAASILWSLVQAVLYFQGQLEMLMIVIPAFVPSIVFDLILAGVVFIGTRQQPPEQPLKKDRELLAEASAIVSNPLNVGVPVITGAFAALCVLVLPFWIIGIPGVRNDFARGWEMGLDVIIWYPISWIVVFSIALFLKKIMGISHQRSLDVVVSICLILFLGLALLRLGQAFSLIAGS